jgi:periplasmic protein TonB
MDFARQQRDPTRHVIGITFVILFHALVIYGLVTGLARRAVEVIKKPLTATIVKEVKLPPPPPPKKIEIPKTPPPLKTYIPPPDIPVPFIQQGPVITAVTPTPPPAPPVIAPPAPPPPPPAKPEVRQDAVRIAGDMPDYPREARRKEIESKVKAHLYVDEKGNVTEVKIIGSNPPTHIFDRDIVDVASRWKFAPTGKKYIAEVMFNFTLR